MQLVVKIAPHEGFGYRAWCPALPGCYVFAQTHEEAKARIHEAVAGYLASLDVSLPRELDRKLRTNTVEMRHPSLAGVPLRASA